MVDHIYNFSLKFSKLVYNVQVDFYSLTVLVVLKLTTKVKSICYVYLYVQENYREVVVFYTIIQHSPPLYTHSQHQK